MLYHYEEMESFSKPEKLDQSLLVEEKRTDAFELAAFGASCLCLFHCLALPLMLAALPAFSDVLGTSDAFHVWILALAIPASGVALLAGRSRHGQGYPLVLGTAGLALLAGGAFLVDSRLIETWGTVAGSVMLGAAHIANWRLRNVASARR